MILCSFRDRPTSRSKQQRVPRIQPPPRSGRCSRLRVTSEQQGPGVRKVCREISDRRGCKVCREKSGRRGCKACREISDRRGHKEMLDRRVLKVRREMSGHKAQKALRQSLILHWCRRG